MAQQPVVVQTPPFSFWPIRWLLAFLVLVICVLGIMGVVPGDKTMFMLVGAVDLAVFF